MVLITLNDINTLAKKWLVMSSKFLLLKSNTHVFTISYSKFFLILNDCVSWPSTTQLVKPLIPLLKMKMIKLFQSYEVIERKKEPTKIKWLLLKLLIYFFFQYNTIRIRCAGIFSYKMMNKNMHKWLMLYIASCVTAAHEVTIQ